MLRVQGQAGPGGGQEQGTAPLGPLVGAHQVMLVGAAAGAGLAPLERTPPAGKPCPDTERFRRKVSALMKLSVGKLEMI